MNCVRLVDMDTKLGTGVPSDGLNIVEEDLDAESPRVNVSVKHESK